MLTTAKKENGKETVVDCRHTCYVDIEFRIQLGSWNDAHNTEIRTTMQMLGKIPLESSASQRFKINKTKVQLFHIETSKEEKLRENEFAPEQYLRYIV